MADNATSSSGNCAVCSTTCTKKCSKCKEVYYCSVEHQKQNWKTHGRTCSISYTRTKPWTVNKLLDCVMEDRLPALDAKELSSDYGFANCKDETEESNLLGVYVGLFNVIECDAEKLHEACMAGKLKEFIIAEYTKFGRQSVYYQWFLKNTDVVNNHHTPPTPTS